MRLIGVIDLRAGRAVHARGGRRELYQPVGDVAGVNVQGDPVALARRYLALGVQDVYVADLDAIGGAMRQDRVLRDVAAAGAPLWLDAGVSSAAAARECCALGAARVIVGLETLRTWADLAAVCSDIGGDRTAFSLDLRDGRPLGSGLDARDPAACVARAVAAGAGAVIVLDVASVGMGTGPDVALVRRIREAAPGVRLIAGGGMRHQEDLDALTHAGCEAALVATALHSGALHPSATR